ncbi:MAG TPA: MBL fold metallo-hydrolase [Actinomycetota bacterium]|nr:MBL fold metallo-hydrolase [Actinomycetota bacterium]
MKVHRIVMPTPYAVGPVNGYLIDAEPVTLVDAGINMPQAQNALVLGLEAAGFFPEGIERILITHAHPDHYGLVGFLQERSGATVYFPKREIARVRDRQMLFEVGRLLMEAGMPLELLFKMDQQRKQGPKPGIDHDVVVPIDEGDRFEFSSADGSFELITLHMPGHTGGHVVFHEPERGVLFAGDQLLPEVSPNPLLEPSLDEPGERRRSLKEYLASLERMGNLGLTLAYPGHGGEVTDPKDLIDSTIEHHLKRKVQVAGFLTNEPRTVYDIAQEVYPNVRDYDVFLAVSEVVAHLDLVVEDGDATVETVEGVTLYRRTPG